MMNNKKPNPRRVRQFERQIRTFIDENGGADGIFSNFKHRPSDDALIKMFLAGKFGGTDDPLIELGGIDFALEYAFDEFNELSKILRQHTDWQNKTVANYHVINRGLGEPWGNLFFSMFIDKDYAPFVTSIDKNEFIRFTNQENHLIHEATKSIVFSIALIGVVNRNDKFVKRNNPTFLKTEFKSPSIIWHYGIWISSPDTYAKENINLEKAYNPEIMNAIYRKNKLLDAKVPWDGFDDHVVYTATDIDGVLRYIGEGRSDRYLHVNSGKSHNFKINEHFFLYGKMDVNILAKGLTKPKALAIEKFLIVKNSKTLWNIKDNPDVHK